MRCPSFQFFPAYYLYMKILIPDLFKYSVHILNTIAGITVYLCHFHVVQAWKRWLTSAKTLNADDKDEILNK